MEDCWQNFNVEVYSLINYLQTPEFIGKIQELTESVNLKADSGLHGSGLFLQKNGGQLNPHLDYKVHPKLGYERIFSLLLYLSSDWDKKFGGHLELYGGNEETPNYSNPIEVEPIFNRLVLFECTHTSWHAVSSVHAPDGFVRKVIGLFYLKDTGMDKGNSKARYAPRENQINDDEISEIIRIRETVGCKAICS